MLRPLILVLALGSGGGAAWIAAQGTADNPPVTLQASAGPALTGVLVAVRDLPRGSEITPEALQWRQWPADAVPPSFIDRTAQPDALRDVSGSFTTRAISAEEPIVKQAVTQDPGGYLAAMLEPGKRAVAIHASTQSTAGGFILPNDRVDVLHTTASARSGDGPEVRSRTILRGVRILAIDQTTTDTDSGTVLGKTATLELTEAQAEAITAAEATGTLSLSLRPIDEALDVTSADEDRTPLTIRVHRGTVIEDVVIN